MATMRNDYGTGSGVTDKQIFDEGLIEPVDNSYKSSFEKGISAVNVVDSSKNGR